jgi:selenocysteine lyase/cysteine desulfurase
MTHASNVCGAIVPVEDLCRLGKAYGATTVVDMSQTAGLLPLPLASDVFDFAVFAGHKTLLAPFGVGGFICKHGTRLEPVFFGGNGINSIEQNLPDDIVQMEEVGSQNTYAIAGLKASTDWILERGIADVHASENDMRNELLSTLRSHGSIRIVANDMRCGRIGVVSALFDDYSPDEAEMVLGQFGIAVRSGIQCAPYAHQFLDTLPAGTVRFSVSALTTENDMLRLREALDGIEAAY